VKNFAQPEILMGQELKDGILSVLNFEIVNPLTLKITNQLKYEIL
jgi:hypothetical protein